MEDADFMDGGGDGSGGGDYDRALERREQAAHHSALESVRERTPVSTLTRCTSVCSPTLLPPTTAGSPAGRDRDRPHADGAGGV